MYSLSALKNRIIVFYLYRIRKLQTPADIIIYCLKKNSAKLLFENKVTNTSFKFSDLLSEIAKIQDKIGPLLLKPKLVVSLLHGNQKNYYTVRALCHFQDMIFFAIPPGLDSQTILYFLKETKTTILCSEFFNNDIKLIVSHELPLIKLIVLEDTIASGSNSKSFLLPISKSGLTNVATYNLSSGTTGKTPKIVELSNKNWITSVYNFILNATSNKQPGNNFLCTLPYATAGSTTFLPTFLSGMTQITISPGFAPAELSKTLLKNEVNRLFITPTNFYKLFYYSKNSQIHYPKLSQIIIGTEVTSSVVIKKAIEYFGPIIYISYGMVEVLPPLTMLSPNDYFDGKNTDLAALKTVGKVLKGISLKISDNQGNNLSFPEKKGIISIKGKTVSNGYLNNPEEQKNSFHGSWFVSSDFGQFDQKGFLRVLGRKEDLIFSHDNRLVFASEIEDLIYTYDEVKHCAVSVSRGKTIVVISTESKDCESLKIEIKKTIEHYLGETIVTNIITTNEIPVTSLGKLNRNACKNLSNG